MLFSSLEFIFLFLPLTVGVYFALPRRGKWRNGWLLVSGLCFYGLGEPGYLPLMVAVIIADYCLGAWIYRCRRNKKSARGALTVAVTANLLVLAAFKYFDPLGWGLPVGISFYTFQAMSYVIDVYRGEVERSRSLVDFGAYVSLFPQLIAGPIVRYSQVERELWQRQSRLSDIAAGLRTFCAGLAKKVILANSAGQVWERLAADSSTAGAWAGVVFFAFQIYFDFSGYSDMAVGLGRVLGFDFPQNFNYPYISRSITEFWRRWHMTLSSWFRQYVYIPLGGNRGGRLVTYRNLLITWVLTGLWHGSGLNFLLWGLYFALVLIIEKAFLRRALEAAPRWICHIYALALIAVGWVIFACDGSTEGAQGVDFLLRLTGVGAQAVSPTALYEIGRGLPFAIIMAVGCTPLPKRLYLKMRERAPVLCNIIAPLSIFILSVAYIVSSGYDPFLYFRF